jgi:teichuronic acid biosynthesis glycosyltransferase TuaC
MSEGMRVTFLVTNYPAAGSPVRGVFHRTLAEGLSRAGAEVEVVAPVPRAPWPLSGANERWAGYAGIPGRYDLNGVAVHRPRYWQVPRASALGFGHGSFARCLRAAAIARRPDVIHAHFAYPCGIAAEIAVRSSGTPVVLTLHGSDVNTLPEKSRRLRRFLSTSVERADFVTTVSRALAERTQALTGRRPEVVPIGIDLRRYRALPPKAEARRALGLPPDARLVLFVGGLWESKGVLLLRDALHRIDRREVVGVFVGDGPARPALAGRPGIRDVGAVPHELVASYLRAADVLALPSYSEGMPTVIVEAGAAGLPVVASDVGGIAEILGEERGFVVPVGDVGRLAEALDRVLCDRATAEASGRRLQEFVERDYDVDRNARKTLEIYEGLR